MKKLIALAILVLVAQFATVAQSQAANVNSVSGIVFYDLNGDGAQAPNEKAAPNAIVNIQEVGSDLIESMIADENGYFNTGEMAYGIYHVWTEIDGKASSVETIEISEINGTAVVYLPVAQSFNVMLPFVSN